MSRSRDLLSVSALTDEQLGRRALDGDRAAFTELFGRHEAGLLNVAHRLTGSREDAADVAQEAFLRVFARLDDLAGREVNLAAYLHRTARNLVYDRGARRGREAPDDEIERAAGADEAMEADPELTSLVSAVGEDVRAANARLPERHRLVLALRELEDMSYEDIGRVLDVTPGAVAQLLSRARMALRRELRLQQVDPERMDPACRARLGDIGALIDGELNPDRAQVLVRHLEACDACRAARAAFEEARVTYRAWPPLLALGLGADTARAAEGRGLVRFSRSAGRGPAGWLGARRRGATAVGVGILALLLLGGVPTLVATRSGAGGPPGPGPAPGQVQPAAGSTAAAAGTTRPAPLAGGTTAAAAPAAPLPPAGPEPSPGTTAARARIAAAAAARHADPPAVRGPCRRRAGRAGRDHLRADATDHHRGADADRPAAADADRPAADPDRRAAADPDGPSAGDDRHAAAPPAADHPHRHAAAARHDPATPPPGG